VQLPIINTLLGLLFAVFATALKLKIAEGIRGSITVPPETAPEKVRDDSATDAAEG
jgi:hypothetical protein